MSRRQWVVVCLCGVIALACVWVRLSVGNGEFALPAWGGSGAAYWELRGLRAAIGVVVGVALGVAGVMLQSLLRNPLASPDLLGIAAGASLAVTIANYLHQLRTGEWFGMGGTEGAAVLGAFGVLGLVYLLSQRRGLIDPVAMILLGVVVGIVCSAWIVFVQQLMPDKGALSGRWLLGLLDEDAGWWRVGGIGAVTLLGAGVGAALGPSMDAASMGDDEARSVGVSIGRLRGILFVLSGVLTAGAVTLAGPIGFVGLICPHAVRLLGGSAHRGVVIGAGLLGAALVVGADALVKAVDLGSGNMPIGVLMAIVGGPVFIGLLWRERG